MQERTSRFDSGPQQGNVFVVNKISLGYIYDFARWKHSQGGVGAVGSASPMPAALNPAYGTAPGSVMVFARAVDGIPPNDEYQASPDD